MSSEKDLITFTKRIFTINEPSPIGGLIITEENARLIEKGLLKKQEQYGKIPLEFSAGVWNDQVNVRESMSKFHIETKMENVIGYYRNPKIIKENGAINFYVDIEIHISKAQRVIGDVNDLNINFSNLVYNYGYLYNKDDVIEPRSFKIYLTPPFREENGVIQPSSNKIRKPNAMIVGEPHAVGRKSLIDEQERLLEVLAKLEVYEKLSKILTANFCGVSLEVNHHRTHYTFHEELSVKLNGLLENERSRRDGNGEEIYEVFGGKEGYDKILDHGTLYDLIVYLNRPINLYSFYSATLEDLVERVYSVEEIVAIINNPEEGYHGTESD